MVTSRSGKVRDLERQRVERLADELLPELREHGLIITPVADIEDVDRWRAAARRAARRLGARVRTGTTRQGVAAWAVIEGSGSTYSLVARALLNRPPR